MQKIIRNTFGLARTPHPRGTRHGGAGVRARRVLLVALMAAVFGFASTAAGAATTPRRVTSPDMLTSPAPGKWTEIGTTNSGGPAAMWRAPDNRDWVMWAPNSTTYDLALLAPDGGIAAGRKVAMKWAGLANNPTLISNGSTPLVVFSGMNGGKYDFGCIVGAVPGAPYWTPTGWSLSSACDSSNVGWGSAAVNAKGVISAAYGAIGGGVFYQIGVSPFIPSPGTDPSFLNGMGPENEYHDVVDSDGNGDFYLAFNRYFATPASGDGVWVKDLSSNGPLVQAPRSSTYNTSTAPNSQPVAFANRTGSGGGVFAAYCVGNSCSHLVLWRDGAKHARVVPDSAGAFFYEMASGPGGRLWIAWMTRNASTLYTVRTNEADTKFGPVEKYATPLFTVDSFAISGGPLGRLDVTAAGDNNSLKPVFLATQSLTALTLSGGGTIANTTSNKVTFVVTDAGDPVAGVKVSVDGHTALTNPAGKAVVTFAKGTSPGSYTVRASEANYFPAHGSVLVEK
ncbi:MAG: hypothetical protein WB592_06645 [Acidimicrobiales bacterium]